MFKLLKLAFLVLISLMIFSCQESNPVIGTWNATVESSYAREIGIEDKLTMIVEFKEKEIIQNIDGKIKKWNVKYEKISDSQWKVTVFKDEKPGKSIILNIIDSKTMKYESEKGKTTTVYYKRPQ